MTADCPACSGAWPRADTLVTRLSLSSAYLNEDQFFPGWTFLVLRRHATELYGLTAAERAALIEEVSAVARALAGVFGAVKMNYELLGNQVAHVHWHIVPRLAGDPSPRLPVWTVPHEPRRLPEPEFAERIAAIRAALGR